MQLRNHLLIAAAVILLGTVIILCLPPLSARLPWGLQHMPWTLAFVDETGLLTVVNSQGQHTLLDQKVMPEGAAASPIGAHVAAVTTGGQLWLVPTVYAPPVKLQEGPIDPTFWREISPWSRDGRALVFISGGNVFYLVIGRQPQQLTTTGDVFTATLSPDRSQIAFGRKDKADKDLGLWVISTQGGEPREIVPATGDIFTACCPQWSPDGLWLAFLQAYEGGALGVVRADGTDSHVGIEAAWVPLHWLPDSQTVLFPQVAYGEAGDGLWRYDRNTQQTERLTERGRSVAYAVAPLGATALVAEALPASKAGKPSTRLSLLALPDGKTQGAPHSVAGIPLAAYWSEAGDLGVLLEQAGQKQLKFSHEGLDHLENLSVVAGVAGWVHCR